MPFQLAEMEVEKKNPPLMTLMVENPPVIWDVEKPPVVTVKKLQNPPVRVTMKKTSFSSSKSENERHKLTPEKKEKFSRFIDEFTARAKMKRTEMNSQEAVEKKAKELADFFVETLRKNEVGIMHSLSDLKDFFSVFIYPKKLKKEMKEKYLMKIFHTQTGGCFAGLATAALPMVAKALGLAGLSFGAEKALKKIFGSGGIPPEAVELGKLVDKLSPTQKKGIKQALANQGIVMGSGQVGGFLGLLASLGIPLAISLVKKVLGKGMRLQPSEKGMRLQPSGKGMRLQPPPTVGSWNKKKMWMYP